LAETKKSHLIGCSLFEELFKVIQAGYSLSAELFKLKLLKNKKKKREVDRILLICGTV
jgi:hypothetical protein